MKQEIVKEMWDNMEDIPFDEDTEGNLILGEDYEIWPKGTEREEIWHWFDENYENGITNLLYGER